MNSWKTRMQSLCFCVFVCGVYAYIFVCCITMQLLSETRDASPLPEPIVITESALQSSEEMSGVIQQVHHLINITLHLDL